MNKISRKFLVNLCYASALWSGAQVADANGFIVKASKLWALNVLAKGLY